MKALLDYVKQNYMAGLDWNIKQGNQPFSQLISVLQEEEVESSTQKPEKQEEEKVQTFTPPPLPGPGSAPGGPGGPPSLSLLLEKNPDKAPTLSEYNPKQAEDGNRGALFSQINVGMDDIKKHLRHVDKKQKRQELEATERPQERAPVQKVQTQQKKVQKPPNKFLKGDNWYVEYYENATIEFTAEEINNPKQCVFIDNCKRSCIKIDPKINTIFTNKCERVQVMFNELIATVEVMNCKNMEITVQQKCPSINIDKCESIHISLMKDRTTEIISSKTAEINVSYYDAEEDDMAKDAPVPEQFITVWNPEKKRFDTKIFDQDLG